MFELLPADWKMTVFGQSVLIANGQVDPKISPYNSMFHIGPENIEQNTGRIVSVATCTELGLISGKYEFDENAIVYSKIRPNLNKVCRPKFHGVCSADMYPLWPCDDAELNAEYLLYFMLSPYFVRNAVAVSMRTGMPKINRGDLNSIPLPLPPIAEQQKIACILSTWDAAVDCVQKLLENSRQQKKALMQQLLTGKRRLPIYTGQWHCKTLHSCGVFRSGYGFPLSFQGKSSGKYPFYKVSDMNHPENSIIMSKSNNWVDIDDKSILGLTTFPAGGVIFAKIGAAINLERKRILSCDSLIDNNLMCFIARANMNPKYFLYLFSIMGFRKYASTTALPSLSSNSIGDIQVFIPEIEEQNAIVEILEFADRHVEIFSTMFENYNNQKKYLMQQLLTGKRRVKIDPKEINAD